MYDVWVVKVDWEGEIIWERTFGGSSFDYAYAIGITTDGGYIVGGGLLPQTVMCNAERVILASVLHGC